jgi:hypothetical protein
MHVLISITKALDAIIIIIIIIIINNLDDTQNYFKS